MSERVIVFIDYENLRFSARDQFHRLDDQAALGGRGQRSPSRSAQEKGVDVALAVDFVRLAYEGAYDAGIIVSRDTDLLPALETVTQLGLARVEVAAWRKSSRLNFPAQRLPWCHQLDGRDYEAIRDSTDYLKGRP